MRLPWYLSDTAVRPRFVLRVLDREPNGLRVGLAAVLLIGALYTLTVAGLAFASVQPSLNPWIGIAPERCYFAEAFFTLPASVVAWLLDSYLICLLARALGCGGSFTRTAAPAGVALSVPLYLTCSIESAMTVATRLHRPLPPPQRRWMALLVAYQGAAALWLLALGVATAIATTGLTGWRAVLAGGIPTALVLALMVIVIR